MRPLVFFRRLFGRDASARKRGSPCESCPLSLCPVGLQVTVLCIDCPALDAARLRTLGVYEGARVGIVDTRSGMLLDVRGARLALGWSVVRDIRVMPACP